MGCQRDWQRDWKGIGKGFGCLEEYRSSLDLGWQSLGPIPVSALLPSVFQETSGAPGPISNQNC